MKIAKYLSEMDLLNAECKLAEVKKVQFLFRIIILERQMLELQLIKIVVCVIEKFRIKYLGYFQMEWLLINNAFKAKEESVFVLLLKKILKKHLKCENKKYKLNIKILIYF